MEKIFKISYAQLTSVVIFKKENRPCCESLNKMGPDLKIDEISKTLGFQGISNFY